MNTQDSRARRQGRLLHAPEGRTGKKTLSAAPDSGAFSPDRLPDPWLIDTEFLLGELARIRELALRVPLSNGTFLPTNTVVDAIWELEKLLRHLVHLHREGQRAFGRRAAAKPAPEKMRASASLKRA